MIKIKRFLHFFLKSREYRLVSGQEVEQGKIYQDFLEKLIINKPLTNSLITESKVNVLDLEIIVFSKDRAIQLHALLASLLLCANKPVSTTILYYASTKEFNKAYQEVEHVLNNTHFKFIQEKHFKKDVTDILECIDTSKVMFLVDDIVFKETVDLEDFIKPDINTFVPSLRMGNHLNFSYTMQAKQPLPEFIQTVTTETDKIIWKWDDGKLDWNYPLSVDGHLFATHEIRIMLGLIDFKAPNSLEEQMQNFRPLYLKRFGIAYKVSKIVNIPCNKVQIENDNISSNVSAEELLKVWQNGYQIDVGKILHFTNVSAHQFIPFSFIKRN